MKLFTIVAVPLLALAFHGDHQVEAQQALRQRKVSPKYSFLVSNIIDSEDLCITAPNVNYDFASLEVKPCDTVGRPKNQLWSLDANGKIHSALDYDKCMVVDHGTDIYNGARIKIARCDLRTSLNRFTHNGGSNGSSKLQVLVNGAFCIAPNGGNKEEARNTIHTKPCQESSHNITFRS